MGDNFLPKTEQEVIEPIIKNLLRRASEACYWKEDAENRAEKADTIAQREIWEGAADRHKTHENIWLEAVAIVKGERE